MLASTIRLGDDEVQSFHRQGFLRLERLTDEGEVERLRTVYDALFDDAAGIAPEHRVMLAEESAGSGGLHQVLDPDRYAPELRESEAYANAHAVAVRLLGDEAVHMGMHAIRKPALDGAETPWHQDEAYWDPAFAHDAVSVWVPLQPATPDNGCMQFVPGSHRQDVRPHRLAGAGGQALVLADPDPVADVVACPLPPGGATIHAGRTLHHTGPNRTDQPRRALIMAFAVPGRPLAEPRDFPWQPPEWTA